MAHTLAQHSLCPAFPSDYLLITFSLVPFPTALPSLSRVTTHNSVKQRQYLITQCNGMMESCSNTGTVVVVVVIVILIVAGLWSDGCDNDNENSSPIIDSMCQVRDSAPVHDSNQFPFLGPVRDRLAITPCAHGLHSLLALLPLSYIPLTPRIRTYSPRLPCFRLSPPLSASSCPIPLKAPYLNLVSESG